MEYSRADLNKRPSDVKQMFNATANRYDLMNDVLSLGAVRQWRKDVLEAVAPQPGMRILDLAAGTGTSSLPFLAAGAQVYSTDLSYEMLSVGITRHPNLCFVAGDALALPYADDSFDTVTTSFGLRNVENTVAALTELRRVTKPGGQLVICEFSTPTSKWFRKIYQSYLLKAIPSLASFSSNKPAYDYLAESIIDWPDQPHLAGLIAQAGWKSPAWRNLSGGIVALHRGWCT